MRKIFLGVLVMGLGLAAWAQAWDTMIVTVTINPAYADAISVPPTLQIAVARLAAAVSDELKITYTTDYTDRDITVAVQEVSGTIPSGFKLYITTVANPGPDDWLEIDLDPIGGYSAVILFTDVRPGENRELSFWIKADATEVAIEDVGAQFTITLKFTLVSL